ncbi:GH92 family glycosyl hydrolase [Niabella drilacis]|uniref:Alpha-1,2-mannosidase, putative n=1 Tax=Niabella drilacis (strain DSM 25811 / CCM 8410 / CCUG 62505 / LMG 26954 / E90) TaxID=1285928 RepID=A0A1G6U2X6_NIADE|nr:GH92 family glycosyl hydrolase [Niabella drilacis]SDD34895.1 alpha-1,2-mannosidase, putative [Niabella drilacis]
MTVLKKLLAAGLIVGVFVRTAFSQPGGLVHYVNTLQGTNSAHELTRGNTYPTTALPFGMHTWTAQTGRNGDGWKYQYTKNTIRGFQQAHQCSSWTNDYAVFSLMPVVDNLVVNEQARAAVFRHEKEVALPHYYKVALENGITTEMSPAERGAHLRFRFPEGHKSFLVLDGYTGLSGVEIDPAARKITGYVNNGRGFQKGWKNYFVIRFDQPFTAYGTWDNRTDSISAGTVKAEGAGRGAYLEFRAGVNVQAKVASSYISQEQAERNLERELGADRTLEQTKARAAKIWNEHLSKVLVEGGSEADKATFYSCFFRASLFSRKFYELDKDGNPYYFSPYDGKVHKGYLFTDTGFWDTFRAQFPLNALLHPTMHGRYVSALLDAQEQCGWLPAWSFPNEQGSMIGNHAISLLADAWAKGLHTFDPLKALKAYDHEANHKGPWGPANGRDGYKEYNELGYVPYPRYREATAKTLEYAYDDFCGYYLAKAIGNREYMDRFGAKMFNYQHVFDPSKGFMLGKDEQGNWIKNFDPTEWGGPYTEGNAWHWVWSVFHDIAGLKQLLGGDRLFTAKLDSVFSVPNTVKVGTYGGLIHEMTEMVMADMGQYAHGNQPIQHMVYLYNYANEPWKAQYHAREVMKRLYSASENGYPGDEDQGQTSSWYVLSALGLYSVTPGTNEYVIGSPLFKKATITLENGKQFVIEAGNNSAKNVYINRALLNGKVYSKNFITYQDIVKGGRLHFEMSATPNKKRGLEPSDRPFSVSLATP